MPLLGQLTHPPPCGLYDLSQPDMYSRQRLQYCPVPPWPAMLDTVPENCPALVWQCLGTSVYSTMLESWGQGECGQSIMASCDGAHNMSSTAGLASPRAAPLHYHKLASLETRVRTGLIVGVRPASQPGDVGQQIDLTCSLNKGL